MGCPDCGRPWVDHRARLPLPIRMCIACTDAHELLVTLKKERSDIGSVAVRRHRCPRRRYCHSNRLPYHEITLQADDAAFQNRPDRSRTWEDVVGMTWAEYHQHVADLLGIPSGTATPRGTR